MHEKLAALLVGAWIFSIPLSLAYHFNKQMGLVNGFLVDYRIPQIQLSALIGAAAAISLLTLYFRSHPKGLNFDWFGKVSATALLFAFCFQVTVGIIQFATQHSVFGYIPFGEVDYSSPQIAKGVFAGSIRKLPYGTTAHPNVLAGFLVLSLILLLLQPFVKLPPALKVILMPITLGMCLLAQSLLAGAALLLAAIIHLALHLNFTLPIRIGILLIPIASVLIIATSWAANSSNPSLSRRANLQTIAIRMIQNHPILGVGWNNFTLTQEKYGFVPGSIRFLQPVHNDFLLLGAELGIVGWILIATGIIVILKLSPHYLPVAGAVTLIASLDHYLLTLTTGRLILIFVVFFLALSHRHRLKMSII